MKPLIMLSTSLAVAIAFQPELAQGRAAGGGVNAAYSDGYDNGYRDGMREAYRAGYEDGRANRRYDGRYGPPAVIVTERSAPPTVVVIDREDRWRQRYARTYTYNDDSFYRECRQTVDPAGVIGGAMIGGLLGNAVGRGSNRAGTTIAGVVVGGTLGAALTRDLDCRDRSYAYKTYYDGFNSGRPNSRYEWRNPSNGNYGVFVVGDYYTDPDGFRCSTYTQKVYVNGRPATAQGRACQQPDGAWTIVN